MSIDILSAMPPASGVGSTDQRPATETPESKTQDSDSKRETGCSRIVSDVGIVEQFGSSAGQAVFGVPLSMLV